MATIRTLEETYLKKIKRERGLAASGPRMEREREREREREIPVSDWGWWENEEGWWQREGGSFFLSLQQRLKGKKKGSG